MDGVTGAWFDRERAGPGLADERLTKRRRKLLELMGGAMGASLALACQDWANTNAAYRFFSNDRGSEADILSGHVQTMGSGRQSQVVHRVWPIDAFEPRDCDRGWNAFFGDNLCRSLGRRRRSYGCRRNGRGRGQGPASDRGPGRERCCGRGCSRNPISQGSCPAADRQAEAIPGFDVDGHPRAGAGVAQESKENRLEAADRSAGPIAHLSHFLTEIAKLGGYLARANDLPPGTIVMWRGLSRLTDIELGAMIGAKGCG
jgi:Transposase DNA-binding